MCRQYRVGVSTRCDVRLLLLALCLALCAPRSAASQAAEEPVKSLAQVPSPLALEIRPVVGIPVGDSAKYFSLGGGLGIDLAYSLPGTIFGFLGGIGYSYLPDNSGRSLSLAMAQAGVMVDVPIVAGVGARLFGAGGYYFATINDLTASVFDPYLSGGLRLKFLLGRVITLDVGARYTYYAGLYQGVNADVGVQIPLGNLGGSVDVPTLQLRPAFPVFYKYYDDHPVGTLLLKSALKVVASGVRVQVFVKQFMDSPKVVSIPGVLQPGASREVEIFALFNDKVLDITEGTKVAAEIKVTYVVDGQTYENRQVETLTVYGRNAMTWDDNRKAAAYVTAKEPQVLDFARSVTSYVHSKEGRSIASALQSAVSLHEALDLYGLNYTPNPVTPYSEASKQKDAIDFLQFPRETFKYRAGDCSDISILYAALLQAVGIQTAFITVPGHIFVAVNTGLPPDRAQDVLADKGMLVVQAGTAWIPVEITMRHQGFLKAWQLGAKEWTESSAAGLAGFYPVQDAWSVYQPVGLPGTADPIAVPPMDQILAAYMTEIGKCINATVGPQIAKLQAEIASSKSLSAMNTLGVLYARYGQADKAEQTFKQVLAVRSYLPTLLNLGNLYYQREDWSGALRYYQQANDVAPNNPRILLGLSRANRELQNFDAANRSYEKLKSVDPALAAQFAYLASAQDSGTRAAEVDAERRAVLWESGD
jgi:tetratricopeptide (TPR) repeat protein